METKLPGGVFAAALTPMKDDGSLDLDAVVPYLDFLARRGCHGALLFGTTGEGPSFSLRERVELGRVARGVWEDHPDFLLMMGTGTPSLDETVELTRAAFALDMQGVVVLPPYFQRKAGDDGLFAWFGQVIRRAVPAGGFFLGYNIPQMTGMHFSLDLLDRLKNAYPRQFLGMKNSWTEASYAEAVGQRFGPDLLVLTGYDNLFQLSLRNHAVGCITASASLISPLLRRLWDTARAGGDPSELQAEVDRIRAGLDAYPPAPPLIKGLLACWHGFAWWNVCPPMVPASEQAVRQAAAALNGPFS